MMTCHNLLSLSARRAITIIAVALLPSLLLLQTSEASAFNTHSAGCNVFKQNHTAGGQIRLPAGPMTTPEDPSGFTGFKPRSTLMDVGDLDRVVYDCAENMTANGIAALIRQKLRHAGYSAQFTCAGNRCGPARGWKNVLKLYAAPGPGAFNYTLASGRGTNGPEHVAIYAADLDGRPRVVVYDLYADYDLPAKVELDRSQVQSLYESHQHPKAVAQFATGSADIDNVQALRSRLAAVSRSVGKWVIVGHSDSRGSDAQNGLLSWHRAQAVANVLKEAGVSPAAIRLYAVGESLPAANAQSGDKAAANRRVDVFRIKSQPEKKSNNQSDNEKKGGGREQTS